jgi:hypothetical protein
MNRLQQFWFDQLVAGMQSDLHNREYTVSYSRHIAEAVLDDTKRSHREVCALEPSIPDFDNRTYRRALDQAVKTLGTAEEHYARVDAIAKMAP